MNNLILLDSFVVVGGQYYELYDVIDQINENDLLTLIPTPENPHDEYAVEVWWDDHKLGHISRSKNVIIHNLLANNIPLVALVTGVNTEYSKQVSFDVFLEKR